MKKKIGKIVLFLILFISINLIFSSFQDTKAATNIYVPLNGTYTLTETSNQYSVGDSSIASVSVGNQYSYTTACLGTDSNYDGEEVDFADCLYKFTVSGKYYRIQSGTVYLYLGRKQNNTIYYVNGTGWANVTVSGSNGNFTFTRNPLYMFFNTNNYITSNTSSSTFNLYKPIENGEQSSTEIPGYIKVTSITNNKSYLIVKQNGNNYYILYPSTDTANNYAQTAMVKHKSGVDFTITGNSIGTTTLTIGGNTYNIRVFDENDILEPDSNFTEKALTIGLGTTYQIPTRISGFTWSSNDTSIATVASDGTVTPVALGETTLIANLNGVKYSYRVKVIDGASSGVKVDTLIDCDEDTIVYYNFNYGNDFYELSNGEKIYLYLAKGTYRAINFCGAPKDGYALSYLYGGYTTLTSTTASEVQSGNSTSVLNTHASNLGRSVVASGVTEAIDHDIEGMFGFSRASNSTISVTETISLRSEPLSAEITQSVYSINGSAYQSGDQAGPGDTVIFEVTVAKTSTDDNLVVYEGTLTNSLSGAVFIGTSPQGNGNAATQNVTMSSLSSTSQTYYVKYVVPNGTQGNVTNTVSYAYSTYGDETLKTASYKINRQAITASTTVGASAIQNTTITLTKNVSGNMREPDKYFKFLVTINGTNGDQYTISGQDAQVSYNGVAINTSSTYTVGNTNYVYLKGGQTITIGLAGDGITKEVPLNITYSITEQDASEYSTTITGIQGTTKTTGTLTTIDGTNSVVFNNSRDRAALTGEFFEENIFKILLLISGLIFVIKILRDIKGKNKTKYE